MAGFLEPQPPEQVADQAHHVQDQVAEVGKDGSLERRVLVHLLWVPLRTRRDKFRLFFYHLSVGHTCVARVVWEARAGLCFNTGGLEPALTFDMGGNPDSIKIIDRII